MIPTANRWIWSTQGKMKFQQNFLLELRLTENTKSLWIDTPTFQPVQSDMNLYSCSPLIITYKCKLSVIRSQSTTIVEFLSTAPPILCIYLWLYVCRAANEANNPGDWWTQLESNPSVGSTTQLHQTMIRGHEFTSSLLQLEMAQGLSRGRSILYVCALSVSLIDYCSILDRYYIYIHHVVMSLKYMQLSKYSGFVRTCSSVRYSFLNAIWCWDRLSPLCTENS